MASSPSAVAADLIALLRSKGSARAVESARRFGIAPSAACEHLGVSVPTLRALSRPHRRDHALAERLWASSIFEARLLAAFVADPAQVDAPLIEQWTRACDNWALTDTVAFLFDRSPLAERYARALSAERDEFPKRMAFSIMAGMAVHRKELGDQVFLDFLPLIRREACDERNFVRKAVNWALRQIGKRNARLCDAALSEARTILALDALSAKWIARDAIRELEAKRPHLLQKEKGGANPIAAPKAATKRRRK
jgi:3-methyladenine DNA glycosylase AlkD